MIILEGIEKRETLFDCPCCKRLICFLLLLLLLLPFTSSFIVGLVISDDTLFSSSLITWVERKDQS